MGQEVDWSKVLKITRSACGTDVKYSPKDIEAKINKLTDDGKFCDESYAAGVDYGRTRSLFLMKCVEDGLKDFAEENGDMQPSPMQRALAIAIQHVIADFHGSSLFN